MFWFYCQICTCSLPQIFKSRLRGVGTSGWKHDRIALLPSCLETGSGQVDLWEFFSILPVHLLYKGGDLKGLCWLTGSQLPACIGFHACPHLCQIWFVLMGVFLTAWCQAREVFGAVHCSTFWVTYTDRLPKCQSKACLHRGFPMCQTHSSCLTAFLGVSVNTPSITSSQTPRPPASGSPDKVMREGSDSRSARRSVSISTVPEAALKFVWSKFRSFCGLWAIERPSHFNFSFVNKSLQYIHQSVPDHVTLSWQLPRERELGIASVFPRHSVDNLPLPLPWIEVMLLMTVVPTWKLGLTADKQTRLLNIKLWIRAQALASGSGAYFMLAMWPCISYFISMCLNFLICKMGCYEGKVSTWFGKNEKEKTAWNYGCHIALGSVSDGGDGGGGNDGEHGSRLISPVGPSSSTVFGTERGPATHVSSEICPCLLSTVHSLISLLNSLLKKKCFPFNIFISTLLKLTWFRKMQFVSVYLSGFSRLCNQHPDQETQHSKTPTSSAPISPSCPFLFTPLS